MASKNIVVYSTIHIENAQNKSQDEEHFLDNSRDITTRVNHSITQSNKISIAEL